MFLRQSDLELYILRTVTKLNSTLILSTIEMLNLLKRCHVVINIMKDFAICFIKVSILKISKTIWAN